MAGRCQPCGVTGCPLSPAACSTWVASVTSAANGSSASTVRRPRGALLWGHSALLTVKRSFSPLTHTASAFLGRRCDCHYLRGGQQQLQHGHSGGQSDQPPAGGSEPLQEHLEQQVCGAPPPPASPRSLTPGSCPRSPGPVQARQPLSASFSWTLNLHPLCQMAAHHLRDPVPQQARPAC